MQNALEGGIPTFSKNRNKKAGQGVTNSLPGLPGNHFVVRRRPKLPDKRTVPTTNLLSGTSLIADSQCDGKILFQR